MGGCGPGPSQGHPPGAESEGRSCVATVAAGTQSGMKEGGMMTKQRKYPSKPKRGGEQWALKVLIAVGVPAFAAGFFLLRSGIEVTIGSKEATKGAVGRKEMRPTLSAARFA